MICDSCLLLKDLNFVSIDFTSTLLFAFLAFSLQSLKNMGLVFKLSNHLCRITSSKITLKHIHIILQFNKLNYTRAKASNTNIMEKMKIFFF